VYMCVLIDTPARPKNSISHPRRRERGKAVESREDTVVRQQCTPVTTPGRFNHVSPSHTMIVDEYR